jgi:aminoacyl tRNA synthase complex-interacting multifunctional protein 1
LIDTFNTSTAYPASVIVEELAAYTPRFSCHFLFARAPVGRLRTTNSFLDICPPSYRFYNMASSPPALAAVISRFFPATEIPSSSADAVSLSKTVFPAVEYTKSDETEIESWSAPSLHESLAHEDKTRSAESLTALNTHLSTRTTILGSKPSVADIALYARLAPAVKSWTLEERTGEHGYHHIVRFTDFVQHSPLFGLQMKEEERIPIDVKKVLFVQKPVDPKEEKERKKKEKAAAAAASGAPAQDKSIVVGKGKDTTNETIVEKAKDAIKSTVGSAKAAVVGTNDQPPQKKEKKEKAPKPPKAPAAAAPLSPCLIDLRVGHILKAVAHPNADSLYVSTIAVGDAPGTENTSEYEGQVVRTVCSGLNGLIPLDEMQNRKIVAVCNLKPVTMRGIKSAAMVLAASPRLAEGEVDSHAGPVELVNPPEGAQAGERIWFEGWEGEPEGVLNPKKKVWEMCQVGFTTTDDLGVAFEAEKVEQLKGQGKEGLARLVTKSGGKCTVTTLKGATVR